MHIHAVGSRVPVQSNSSRNLGPILSGRLAPWLITSGRRSSLSDLTCRNADPLGVHSHLWQLPVTNEALSLAMSRGMRPGPCAASSRVSTPIWFNTSTNSANGVMIPVGLATVSISASLVFPVTWPTNASITSFFEVIGTPIFTTLTENPLADAW